MGSVLRFDDPALLRAARAADVLHSCGRILASSSGTADTYELSFQADCIQVFISHNWAVERKRKFLALAMHFNLDVAICSAMVALVMGTILTYVVARHKWSAVAIENVPITCAATLLSFCVALSFGHEGQVLLGHKGKSVFLDKLCIHQVDLGLKERGILSLGAFLHKSEKIVVCFTEIYLKKLWTVYEFATFLLVHGEAPELVHIMPVQLPVFVLATSCCAFATTLAYRALSAVGGWTAATDIVGIFTAGSIVVGLARWWALQQLEARAIFKDFSIVETVCASEADRPLVQSNIIALMRHLGYVDVHASDKEALLAFDAFVRTAGSRAFVTSVGRLGVPYKLLLPILLTIFSNSMQMWSAAIGYQYDGHRDASQIALMLAAHVCGVFAMIPLSAAVALSLAKCLPRLRGVAQVAYCGAVAVLTFATSAVLSPTDGILRPWLLAPALESVHSCLGFLIYVGVLLVITACVYRQPRWKAAGADLAWRPVTADVEAPAPPIQSAESELGDAKLDMSSSCAHEVPASPPSPGQPQATEEGSCWEAEAAPPAILDSCRLELPVHIAEPCSAPSTTHPLFGIVEASGRVVELHLL